MLTNGATLVTAGTVGGAAATQGVIKHATTGPANLFTTTNSSSLVARVQTGWIALYNKLCYSDANVDLTFTASGGTAYKAIIVARLTVATNVFVIDKVVGTTSYPAVTQSATTWEIKLYSVDISAADAMTLTNARVYAEMSAPGSVPLGTIIMWSGTMGGTDNHNPVVGSVTDTRWHLCMGATENGLATPDLRDRFIVGSGTTYAVGATGGAAVADLSHTHTNPTTSAGSAHTHTAGALTIAAEAAHTHSISFNSGAEAAHTHAAGAITVDAVGTHAHNIQTEANTQVFQSDIAPGSIALPNPGHSHTSAAGAGGAHTPTASGAATGAGASHLHAVSGTSAAGASHGHAGSTAANPANESSHTHTQAATGSGGSATQSILNPYFALAFLMRCY